MESFFKEPVFAFAGITLLLYLIGIAAAIKSKIQYGYSIFWLIPSLLLFVYPPLIFVIYSYREKAVAKTENLQKHKDKTRFFSIMAILFYVFGTILTMLFGYGFEIDWYGLIAYVAASIMWLLLVSTYIILNKKSKRELNIEERVQFAY